MQSWLELRLMEIRATIAAGNVRTVERRYFPAAVLLGMVLGAILASLSALPGVILFVVGGMGIGYALRSYVSYQRRQRFARQRRF